MSEFLKPQSPLKHKDGAYIYPLTTADQVILENGNRLNTALNDMSSKPKAGFIYPLASSIVPEGFLLCDGAEYSRTEYVELFAAIGTIYGTGDGSTTFNVPNLQTRVPVGAGNEFSLGTTGGEVTHTLTVDEMPAHTHQFTNNQRAMTDTAELGGWGSPIQTVASNDYLAQATQMLSTGGNQPHNNMQPYTIVNYIIATGKDTRVSVSDIIMGAQAIPLEVQYGGTGATNAETARMNLGIKAVARNLLDNSDFTNPVNQRGQASYTMSANGGYTIDRWMVGSSETTVTLAQDGLHISGVLVQPIANCDKLEGKTLTLAAKINGEILCCSGTVDYTDEWHYIAQAGSDKLLTSISIEAMPEGTSLYAAMGTYSATFEWAALYEGEYTAETLPEYQPKGYGAELAECQRYYYQSWTGATIGANGILLKEAFTSARLISVDLPCEMRVTPTISICKTDGTANAVSEYVTSTTVTNVSVVYANNKSFIPAQQSSGFTAGKVYSLHYTASADL